MPAIPRYIIEPIWEQFAALLSPSDANIHPLGCHRRRVPDRLVFDKLVQVLVFGCACDRISYRSCLATYPTTPARRMDWLRGDGEAAGESA